ncbi:hypothetical protein Tco_1232013 [Tanacetum coccineum]
MEEINNFQQEHDGNLYQAWERFKELLMKCPQHYLTKMQETIADAKAAIQEMAEYSQKWHNGTSRSRSTETSDGLAAMVYMVSLRERMELDLEVRLMGKTLVINRSLDRLNGDYIESNDLNEPFELRINQGDDLIPTIKEGEVIEEFRTRDDELDAVIDNYPSCYDYDKKIHIDFLENMDAYRDEGMGDVSDEDKKNESSHPYQKLKGFYKGVLNLGPSYIRDAKTEEWLTHGHISVHEMDL